MDDLVKRTEMSVLHQLAIRPYPESKSMNSPPPYEDANTKAGLPPSYGDQNVRQGAPSDRPNAQVGLPPVLPPSGRFIAQLFVVPGIIILTVVLLVLGLSYLRKREHEPVAFLQQLDSHNPEIRWRSANDLAQILKAPGPATLRWKADAKFALDLAERLDSSFRNLCEEEKKVGAQVASSSDKDRDLLWRKLRHERDYVGYLAAALGDLHVPVGAPVLCAILAHESSPDLKGNTLQRRKALWALMYMGENLRGFAKIPAEQRQQVLDVLKAEVAQGDTARAGWARTAQFYLDKTALPPGDSAAIVKVDETLAKCADSEDRFLRELVAMSFNFWDGPQAEATLRKLAADTGHGTLIRVEEND